MSAPAITLRGSRPAVPTPSWTVVSMLAMAVAVYAAVAAGGEWPLTLAVLLVIGWAFLMVLRHPHLGIMVFLSTFLINYPGVARGVGPLTINNLLGAIFLSLLIWHYYLRRDVWYLSHPLLKALFVIGFVFVMGTLAAEYVLPDQYVQRLITKPIGVKYFKTDYTSRFLFQFFSRLAFAVFIVNFVETPRQLRWVFLALLGCILAALPPSISAYVSSSGEDVRALSKVVNWADNANRFAFGSLIGVAFCYWLGTNARTRLGKVAAAGCAAMLLPLVLLSASRSGFLGMVLFGALMLGGAFGGASVGMSRRGALAGVLLFGGLALLTYTFALSASMQERIVNINPFHEEGVEGSTSTEFRTATLMDSVDLIQRYPLTGVGLGNFRWMHKHLHGRFKPPHNSYVWAMAEGGIPLLGVYLGLFVMLWRRLGALRVPYAGHAELRGFPQFLRVYMVLLLFFSMFADVWIEEHIFLLVGATMLMERWLTSAPAVAAMPPTAGQRGPATPPPAPWGRPETGVRWAASAPVRAGRTSARELAAARSDAPLGPRPDRRTGRSA